MHAFNPAKLFAFLALFFSFSLLALAAPAATDLEARTGGYSSGQKDVKAILVDLKAQVAVKADLISKCAETGASPSVHVDALVGLIKTCSSSLGGVTVSLDAGAKAEIAQLVADIFVSITGACNKLSLKAGIVAYLYIFAKLDVALQLLLLSLNGCVGGVVKLVAGLLTSVTVGLFAKLKLSLCLNVLGLGAGLGLSVGVGAGVGVGVGI